MRFRNKQNNNRPLNQVKRNVDQKNKIKKEHKIHPPINNSTKEQNPTQKNEKSFQISYSKKKIQSEDESIDLSPQRKQSNDTSHLMDDFLQRNQQTISVEKIDLDEEKKFHFGTSLETVNLINEETIDLTKKRNFQSAVINLNEGNVTPSRTPTLHYSKKEVIIESSKKRKEEVLRQETENGEYELLDMDFIAFEKKKDIKKALASKNIIPWLKDRTRKEKGIMKLHYEILDFYDFIKPTEEEDKTYKETVFILKSVIKGIGANWKCKTFGSFPNKLNLPGSDIDLVVITNNSSTPHVKTLKKISSQLISENLVQFLKVIPAKVPIIRATLKETKVNFDISANRKNGYAAKKIIKRILNCWPFLRPLIYVLKFFLKQRHLNETYTGGMSSFLLFNLILAYMQVKKKELLHSSKNEDICLGEYLLGFLEFYTKDFNYEEIGISVKHGGYFFKKAERGWDDEGKPYLLCLENFQDPEQDIGKSCFKIKKVLEAFKRGYENLILPISPVDSYLKSFIFIDDFLINRYKEKREKSIII